MIDLINTRTTKIDTWSEKLIDLSMRARLSGCDLQDTLLREFCTLIEAVPLALLPDGMHVLSRLEVEGLCSLRAIETIIFRITGRLPLMISCNTNREYLVTVIFGEDDIEYTSSGSSFALAAIAAMTEGLSFRASQGENAAMIGWQPGTASLH